MLISTLPSSIIPGIRMSEDTHHRIIRQHAFQTFIRFRGAAAYNDLAGVLDEADAVWCKYSAER